MENKNDYIIVTDSRKKHLIALEDILHVEAIRIYSIFHLKNSTQQFVSCSNLGKVYRELNPEMFLRVHKSHIVNAKEIKSFQFTRNGKVTLSDNTIISVSQRKKTELLLYLKKLNRKK